MARVKNNNLKKPNIETEYTYEQVQELKKCASDPIYFIGKYVVIQHPIHGSVPFALYDYQKEMITAFRTNKHNIILSARQSGKCFFYNTVINTIKKPLGLKKLILKILDRNTYNDIYTKNET